MGSGGGGEEEGRDGENGELLLPETSRTDGSRESTGSFSSLTIKSSQCLNGKKRGCFMDRNKSKGAENLYFFSWCVVALLSKNN